MPRSPHHSETHHSVHTHTPPASPSRIKTPTSQIKPVSLLGLSTPGVDPQVREHVNTRGMRAPPRQDSPASPFLLWLDTPRMRMQPISRHLPTKAAPPKNNHDIGSTVPPLTSRNGHIATSFFHAAVGTSQAILGHCAAAGYLPASDSEEHASTMFGDFRPLPVQLSCSAWVFLDAL